MSATIIPFPSQRFTVVDAGRLNDVAALMIAMGVWGGIQYVGAAKGPGFDTVLIYMPGASNPIFLIERRKNGSYVMTDCSSMTEMSNARTLDGALQPLAPVIRLAETSHAPAEVKRLHWNVW
jgi:hypothetical protein